MINSELLALIFPCNATLTEKFEMSWISESVKEDGEPNFLAKLIDLDRQCRLKILVVLNPEIFKFATHKSLLKTAIRSSRL